jgi:hypothetical protein
VPVAASPASVLAVINVFNEADIIGETVDHFLREGVRVHAVDNWSNDGSFEILTALSGQDAALSVERYPERPVSEYRWGDQLHNVCQVAARERCDWVIHTDADERRCSPWPGVTLAEAIGFVDRLGYNAVDFTLIDFRFLKRGDGEPGAGTWEQRLRHFEFGRRPGHFRQVKAWRVQRDRPTDLWTTGGHEALFEGRRIFPLKFLSKHYPLRSAEHARRKIVVDRMPRFVPEEVARGWHVQYRGVPDGNVPGWSRAGLHAWSDHLFRTEFLVERVSGIGIERE